MAQLGGGGGGGEVPAAYNSKTINDNFTLMMASAQVVETSVNTNNSPSQDYTTNPDDHSNHNIYNDNEMKLGGVVKHH